VCLLHAVCVGGEEEVSDLGSQSIVISVTSSKYEIIINLSCSAVNETKYCVNYGVAIVWCRYSNMGVFHRMCQCI
jgi:hypothetical protein